MKEHKRFSDFEAEIEQLENSFSIEIESQTQDYSPLAGDVLAFTTLIFILGGLAGGFLSGAGKDLWEKLKSLSVRVYEYRCKKTMNLEFDSHHQRMILVFHYKGYQVIVASEHIYPVYFQSNLISRDYVVGFWDDLLSEVLPKLEVFVEAAPSDGTRALYFERQRAAAFGNASVWEMQKRSEVLDIEEIRKIDSNTYKRFGV